MPGLLSIQSEGVAAIAPTWLGRPAPVKCSTTLCDAGPMENPRLRLKTPAQAPRQDASIIRRCAVGSAWIDLDQPCAFSSGGPWCRDGKHLGCEVRRPHLVSAPTVLDQPAFEYVLASKKAKVKRREG